MAYAADQVRTSAQSNARSGPIVRFIWHHQAGTNDDATIGAMVSGSREVSATWTVSAAGRITAVIPEDRRPWTSASRADDGALTVECANSSGPPEYGISDASHEACARLAAYAFKAHGVPLQRASAANGWRGHMGHSEVLGAFGDGYATACPMHLDIDRVIARAAQLTDSASIGGALSQEADMTPEQEALLQNTKNAVDLLVNVWGPQVADPLKAMGDQQTTIANNLLDPNGGVMVMLARLSGQVAGLSLAAEGTVDQAAIEAAAEKGAREALANLTLVAKASA